MELTFVIKHIGDGTICAKITTGLSEPMANFSNSSVPLIGNGLNQKGNTAGAIAFISERT